MTTDDPKKPVELAMFDSPRTSLQCLQRTAAYVENPVAYLNKSLGPEVVQSRRHLLCIPETPLQNDTYGSGEHKSHFEQHIANLFGKSHGLFFITGVQAQSVACKIYSSKSENSLMAWHVTSHLESAEQKAVTTLFRLKRTLLGNDPNSLPTVSEIETVAKLPADERPAMILLEVPNRSLGCETYTFSELEQISQICKDASIALHCDGARIWDIEPYYQSNDGKSLADIAAFFDSVYVSLYKGLGGASGAMLLSNDPDFMLSARIWQRRAGGTPYTLMYELIDCERGFNENVGTFEGKWSKMKEIAEGIIEVTRKYQKNGQPVLSFSPATPKCCSVILRLEGYSAEAWNGARDRVLERTGVKPFGQMRQAGQGKSLDDVMVAKWSESLGLSMKDWDEGSEEKPQPVSEEKLSCVTSYMIYAPELLSLETSVFIDAWVNVFEELSSVSTDAK
jgi:threonine aldolase